MALPFKMFVGGPIAGGKQPVSWVDRSDAVRALIHCIENQRVRGAVNVVGPCATTNGELSSTIARTLRRPNLIPVPKFGLKMLFSEGADVIASGQHVKPERLISSGFEFEHTDLDEVVRRHLL
jgi:NAD dependent epimerase/dehydratase family enzyme